MFILYQLHVNLPFLIICLIIFSFYYAKYAVYHTVTIKFPKNYQIKYYS